MGYPFTASLCSSMEEQFRPKETVGGSSPSRGTRERLLQLLAKPVASSRCSSDLFDLHGAAPRSTGAAFALCGGSVSVMVVQVDSLPSNTKKERLS